MLLLSELKRLAEAAELITLERDCDDEDLTGILHVVSDEIITMHLFEDDGVYDGFTVFEFDQIEEVLWGNREHRAIRHLVDKHGIPAAVELNSTSLPEAALELNRDFSSVAIHTANDEDHYSIANIEAFDEDWCKILTFSTRRSLSRMYKLIQTDSITRLVVNSPYQNSIVELHDCDL